MHLTCAQCKRILEYSNERPSFCGFCGKPIATVDPERTEAFQPSTVPPTGAPGRHASTRAMPETVGGYRLIKELGSGGMGTVFEAEDSASGRRVAVKLIAADFASSQDKVERFRQEGRLASGIAHPRCVFVLAADEEAGLPYIVMELMPGSTLKDLVEQQGPLPPAKAVALILDVIDGLQEAHRGGVIHRDVKPSNCFLQADGRVKIGDFGLSKSLAGTTHLTRTGSFLGTPLFASPEQVRGEAVDHQSDVYSVAATLYYLLTGKAPFQSADAAITLARLVSDPPPPMRSVRPSLPAALDKVVLRGLERQRDRRWRNLEALRTALVPFMPSRLSMGGMGIRLAAYVIDFVVMAPLTALFVFLTFVALGTAGGASIELWLTQLLPLVFWSLYYAVLEGKWGCSLGKRWLGLRVCRRSGSEPPGVARALVRTLLWQGCLSGPSLVYTYLCPTEMAAANPLLALWSPVALVAGVLLVLCTMRARNGYRGPYEFLSGTRVVQLPWLTKPRTYVGRPVDNSPAPPADVPAHIGPFAVHGAICWNQAARVLVGEDKTLSRRIWLWLRPLSEAPLSAARRELGRATRLRWLNCGRHGEWQWDALLAPQGTLLCSLEHRSGRFTWADTRPLLEQLTDELAAAAGDGTKTSTLHVSQVWVQPNGQLQLLDVPLASGAEATRAASANGQPAEVELLFQVASTLLEGRLRPADAPPRPLRAPVPRHADSVMQRLAGVGECYQDIKQVQEDLASTHDQPVEVSRARRAGHLGMLALCMTLGMGCCLVPIFTSPGTINATMLYTHIRQSEFYLMQLEAGAERDLAADLLNPLPGHRVCAVVRWHADKILAERLRRKIADWRAELAARQQTLAWSGTLTLSMMQLGAKETHPKISPAYVRLLAQGSLEHPVPKGGNFAQVLGTGLLLAVGPILAILWSFATRGGVTFGMAGIALARTDGRRPSRLRCAWRTLLFWLPPLTLTVVSMALDFWYWWHWSPDQGTTSWLPFLSAATWWVAAALVPIYAGLALLYPARSLHDRLAGTCLVPR